jgi:iron complex outermembrane receptor protein
VELAVFGTNLTNKLYFDSYIDRSVLAVAGIPPTDVGYEGDRRRVGMRAKYSF